MTRPIPDLPTNGGWRDVPIEAVDEPLVRVADLGPRIVDQPKYAEWGIPNALSESWVREGVGERLAAVAATLAADQTLVVWDGFRPLSVQASLYEDWEARVRADHPDWDEAAVTAEAVRFVTPPSEDPLAPPPHLTGGAVDLTLGDADGRPIDMGTDFDAFVDAAHALAFEREPGHTRDNRRRLFWAMRDAGFTPYAEEWWHFDFGDQFWGLATGRPARYDAAAPPGGSADPATSPSERSAASRDG